MPNQKKSSKNLLLSASKVEEELGSKYFYRAKLYRWMNEGLLDSYTQGRLRYFLIEDIADAAKMSLLARLKSVQKHFYNFKFKIDLNFKNKEICVSWQDLSNKNYEVEVDTDDESEELLIAKILLKIRRFHDLPRTFWPGVLEGKK